jgi:DNA/RNA-binding domain of Phe-tRNA-synthetase-like protein
MTKIEISEAIRSKLPNLVLGCIECDVIVKEENPELWSEIDQFCIYLSGQIGLGDISSNSGIAASRKAYKLCGKDPARYRLSSEALMRRVVKGVDLYKINNVVDLLNLVSLQTGMSIGGFDADKISAEVVFGIGNKDEPYEAIGRGELNIEFLPVFRDSISAFGSPTSDSERTCVTNSTRRFLMVIIGFSGKDETVVAMEKAICLLQKFGGATDLEQALIE